MRFFSYWGDKHRLLQLGSHSLWLNHSFVERLDLSKRILRAFGNLSKLEYLEVLFQWEGTDSLVIFLQKLVTAGAFLAFELGITNLLVSFQDTWKCQ